MRDEKSLLDWVDTKNIKTKRELAMYVIAVCSQKDWSDGTCLDYIIDACYQITGKKPEPRSCFGD